MNESSYQLLTCNKNISNFKLLESIKTTNSSIYNTINSEITDYHNSNQLIITPVNNNLDNVNTTNKKFIFRKGYYFCSYIYNYIDSSTTDNIDDYYITESKYEPVTNPVCPEEDFTNILISGNVPLNLNIIGVIYYYKYLSDEDSSQCKSNRFTFIEEQIVHVNSEKYLIDIVYFNYLTTTIKYNLSYVFYRNINCINIENNRYRKTLKYIKLDYKANTNYNRLTNTIETTIYEATNRIIFNLKKAEQKLKTLLNLIEITKNSDESLENTLSKIIKNTNSVGCTLNIFNDFNLELITIINLITKILTNVQEFLADITTLKSNYTKLVTSLYYLDDFNSLINENNFIKCQSIFSDILDNRSIFYNLKSKLNTTITTIQSDINNLNANIISLKKRITPYIITNNDILSVLFNNSDTYINFNTSLNILNDGITNEDNKVHIFMSKTSNLNINIINKEIINKYKKVTTFTDDFTIELLKVIDENINILDLFNINSLHIDDIYKNIDKFYKYLEPNYTLTVPTFFNLFFKNAPIKSTSGNYYDKLSTPVLELHESFLKTYTDTKEGSIIIKTNIDFNIIFRQLPINDQDFINNVYDVQDKLLVSKKLNILTYTTSYIKNLDLFLKNYKTIKITNNTNRININNICNLYFVIVEKNKHLKNIISNTKLNVNRLTDEKNSKKFDNLSDIEQAAIKLFIKKNKHMYSTFNKYINHYTYNLSNNFYNISIGNFNKFLDEIALDTISDELLIINTYYNLKNCFTLNTDNTNTKENNNSLLDEFIVIAYCFCISMFSEYPLEFFNLLFSLKNYNNSNSANNQIFKILFENVLHNKIFLYTENELNYIKLVSNVEDIILSENIIVNNINNVNNKINIIKIKLIEELNKKNLTSILTKLSIIKLFISQNYKDINLIKKNLIRNEYLLFDNYIKHYETFLIHNNNSNILDLINKTKNYTKIEPVEDSKAKYCITLEKNNIYNCNVCDIGQQSLTEKLPICPPNIPFNLNYDVKGYLSDNIGFDVTTYKIFSYISEPNKELIYKRGRILYGTPKTGDIALWKINKTYKKYTLLDKVDTNEDEIIIVRAHDPTAIQNINTISDNLTIIDNNKNEFYLNNFYINNTNSQNNLNNPEIKYPNSHDLYIKKENNYSYIYFIEDNVKYFMYLNIKKKQSFIYDIIWRSENNRNTPFIKNYAKWRLIKKSEYFGNLFDNPRILYNIRSKKYIDLKKFSEINGLVTNSNICNKYEHLLTLYYNHNYDIINNTKFKLTGYNNFYNISPYKINKNTLFNDNTILYEFINYIITQENNIESIIDTTVKNQYTLTIKNLKTALKTATGQKQFYLIKNPNNDTYLYLNLSRKSIEFIPLFDDTTKTDKLSPTDYIPDNFLWIVQDSTNNDKQIAQKTETLQTTYNTMISNSISNLDKNVGKKINKNKLDIILKTLKSTQITGSTNTQTGGSVLKITEDNIVKINNLIKKLQYIKYNDYRLLLKQLEYININARTVVDSSIESDGIKNRMLLKYIDYITNINQEIYIYFVKKQNKYTCLIEDIFNIKTITFHYISQTATKLKELENDISILISNDNGIIDYGISNVTLVDEGNNKYKININIIDSLNVNISQIYLYIKDVETEINIKKTDVIVYYNINPIYTKLKKYVIKNTSYNQTFNLFNKLNIGKSNKNVFDFSVKLDSGNNAKIHNINNNIIKESLLTYNNEINNFIIKKNKLEENKKYTSKLFYISNDRNILYININKTGKGILYSIPCIQKGNLDSSNIYQYICKNIYNHVNILNRPSKNNTINNLFNYIIILYKNSQENSLSNILESTSNIIDSEQKYINITINFVVLNNIRNSISKSDNNYTNKVTLIFNEMINNNYIYKNIEYDDFINIKTLYKILLNIPFIKITTLKKYNEKFNQLLENCKPYIKYINSIKNNTSGTTDNLGNLQTILNINSDYNIIDILKYYYTTQPSSLSSTLDITPEQNNELKLYLYMLFISNLNINNYLINLFLTCINKLELIYNNYVSIINNLLKKDTRFIDMEYRASSIIDMIYNYGMYIYYYDKSTYDSNMEDPNYFINNQGFYYKTESDIYINYVKKNSDLDNIKNNIYLVSFNDVKKHYTELFPQMIEKHIHDKTLNKPYYDAYKTYINNVYFYLDEILNLNYNNIKINDKVRSLNNETQNYMKTFLKNIFKNNINYNTENIKFNSRKRDKNIVHGDVILYKFKKNTSTNNLYSTIRLLLLKINSLEENWQVFNDFTEIQYNSLNINKIIMKKLNIQSIANYNDIFKSTLVDNYINYNDLLLKEIAPFINKNIYSTNISYFELENKNIYLHLNDYKYKIKLKKLINSNLYLIYKTIDNINYYISYTKTEEIYSYKWIKENYNLIDNINDKLLFIDITNINISDTTVRKEITNNNMIGITYKHKFNTIFSHLNKYINNKNDICTIVDTYYTIHSKTYPKLIDNDNITSIFDLVLSNVNSEYILKDKYTSIGEDKGNYKYYLSNTNCNSYIIYNSFKNIILENTFIFIELDKINLSIKDILENLDNYKEYHINLKYIEKQNIFYQLDKNCALNSNSKKLEILIKSLSDNIALDNSYFINDVTNTNINLFEMYKKQVGLTQLILENDTTFNIIPINTVNEKIIQKKNSKDELIDTGLKLVSINTNLDYYLIKNNKNEFLKTNQLIKYKRPLRVVLNFVQTNNITQDFLWYIKNNIKNPENINVDSNSSKCMLGGEKNLILHKDLREKYIVKQTNEFLASASKYSDLCNNDTNVSFINYDETQDSVSYMECRNKCETDTGCIGFSHNIKNGQNVCKQYSSKPKPNDIYSAIYYDCNKSLTKDNLKGEIKNTVTNINNIKLINNSLYYIKSKTDKYIYLDKSKTVFDNNYLKCNSKQLNQNIYSDNIFKFQIVKNNIINGNCNFTSLLIDNKHILGTYEEVNSSKSTLNKITITYDKNKNKYVWNHYNTEPKPEKWYLEATNNIYEYTINEGASNSDYYCKYYSSGYKLLKINIDKNKNIVSVLGPEQITYNKVYKNENVNIFTKISGFTNTNFNGNVFIEKNSIDEDYFNIYTLITNRDGVIKKHYIYHNQNELIQLNDTTDYTPEQLTQAVNSEPYMWQFELFSNLKNQGYSYDKILVSDTKPDMIGGLNKNKLINGNSYYIKTSNNKYLCANQYYKMSDDNVNNIIAITINSPLALYPQNQNKFTNKFIRASIDLSNTNYKISKKHNIDDDILWKCIINTVSTGSTSSANAITYNFYNKKHDIYLNSLDANNKLIKLLDSSTPNYYNLKIDNVNITIDLNNNVDMIYPVTLKSPGVRENENQYWFFSNPYTLTDNNPYKKNDTVFNKLENGKIYRIINEGVKDVKNTNTYLTINDLNYEILVPNDKNILTNNLKNDTSLWKCVINSDSTYSFICIYNNKKLGSFENNKSLLRNNNNILHLKSPELSINENYLTDKFYVQHNTNEYYNIINSKNLDYYVCGFSNTKNEYDNYKLDQIKYTHKIANENEWLLSCKLEEEYKKNDLFSDEVMYYLYGSTTDTMQYSISNKYNSFYNTIYNETSVINTKNNAIIDSNKAISMFADNFKKYNGFTLETNIDTNPKKESIVNKYGKDNISIILVKNNTFYTIRFINYKQNVLCVRISCVNATTRSNSLITQITNFNKQFNKLEYVTNSGVNNINLSICAPDIYKEIDIFGDKSSIHITYDKEFLNVYVNNILITYTRILNTIFDNIYFASNIETNWNNTLWYKHNKLLDIPLWKTENIDKFKNEKPGIRFISKVNPKVTFEATIEQKTIGYFYIKDVNNKFLTIKNKNNNIYEVEFTGAPDSEDSCLWKLYDTNNNEKNKIKLLDNIEITSDSNNQNQFYIDKGYIGYISNTPTDYYNNIYNSTNVIIRARINIETLLIDETSNYIYSLMDIESSETNKINCTWLNNINGHTSVDYGTSLAGSHFNTDIWNLQYILGRNPKVNDTYYIKYKNTSGIIKIDNFMNKNYSEYGTVFTSINARWNKYNEINEFSNITAQNNIYIESINTDTPITDNVCIIKNDTSAECSYVTNELDCRENPDSLLYIPNENCDNVLYKNYKLLKGVSMNAEDAVMTGGNIWITEKYFYLNNINNIGKTNFHSTFNIKYTPSFDETNNKILNKWKYTTVESKNIIINKIFSSFTYDGYIIDKQKRQIYGITIPSNFVILTNTKEELTNSGYVFIEGKIKEYSVSYKNLKIIDYNTFLNKYNTFYINVNTSIGDKLVKDEQTDIDKLNKCYDFIKSSICIPTKDNKTKITNNIINTDFLKKTDLFVNNNNAFRIINIHGKYLCDLYVNNTHYCRDINLSSIMFQEQFNCIDLETSAVHNMHSISYESLWGMNYVETDGTFEIYNIYTNKSLKTNTKFYIEYIENQYFKQNITYETTSEILYNNEDLYYIYYIENSKKYYLSYEDILINNKYTKSAKLDFKINNMIPFIIKLANYNLDTITHQTAFLSNKIKNICYNKYKTCLLDRKEIDLISNNAERCLNINYVLSKINNTTITPLDIYNIEQKISKKFDSMLGIYSVNSNEHMLEISVNNSTIYAINYNLSNIITDVTISIKIIKDGKESETTDIPEKIISKSLENNNNIIDITEITSNGISNVSKIQIIMRSSNNFSINTIEVIGVPQSYNYSSESIINNPIDYTPVELNINKSLISKKTNTENNYIKIKYIINTENELDLNADIITHTNEVTTIETENIYDFILVFNCLLNSYMFYINDNKFLKINTTKTEYEYINAYTFKLIESTTSISNSNYKIYNIQCFDNSNIYVNVVDNKLTLGKLKHDFIFIKEDIIEPNQILNYNKFINNNILYNPYEISVIITNIDNKFYKIENGSLVISVEKTKILVKPVGISKYNLIDTINDDKINEVSIMNVSDTLYSINGDLNVNIKLYYDYNNLNIYTYNNYKKNKSLLDITSDSKYINRNNKYRTQEYILNNIYIDNIIALEFGDTYLCGNSNNTITFSNRLNNNCYFIEINIKNTNLYKLYSHKFEKFIKFDIVSNMFKLDTNNVLYNNIDILDDTNKTLIFEKINNTYKLYYIDNVYLNADTAYLNDISSSTFTSKTIMSLDNFNYENYDDYCDKMCSITNHLENNLINDGKYNINTVRTLSGEQLSLNLKKYIIKLLPIKNSSYFNIITNIDNNNYETILIKNFKEFNTIKKLFTDLEKQNIKTPTTTTTDTLPETTTDTLPETTTDTLPETTTDTLPETTTDTLPETTTDTSVQTVPVITETIETSDIDTLNIGFVIVTVNINMSGVDTYCNIILWKYKTYIIGRFENKYNIPDNKYLYINTNLNIYYNLNKNMLDFNDSKSYRFNSYVSKPANKKYITINNLTFDILNRFNISLYHYDNSIEKIKQDPTITKNKLSNVRKLYTTCAWGDCSEIDNLSSEEIDKISGNLLRYELTNRLVGGMLDNNMIRFIRPIYSSKEEELDYYLKSPNKGFVNNNTTYYNDKTLLNITFKKNYNIEFYKIFGVRGYTKSYNSLYNKKLFKIDKTTNITDLDYFDSFRHIYPVSYLGNKYAFNKENIWKNNSWFEDNPHYRSLPNWKFEKVEISQGSKDFSSSLVFVGGNNSIFTKKNIIILLLLVILLIYLYCK